MVQYCQGTHRSDETWEFLGRAIHMSYLLGLHSRSFSSQLSRLEREIRARTWENCFIHDRYVTSYSVAGYRIYVF